MLSPPAVKPRVREPQPEDSPLGTLDIARERLANALSALETSLVPIAQARDAAREEAERAFAEADDARA
ncbi:MAG TPA: hypothetical protein VFV07_10140, partial [Rhizomicrobium sp.]|nr:hypothetical protein [Rhizomicrobium sp.]